MHCLISHNCRWYLIEKDSNEPFKYKINRYIPSAQYNNTLKAINSEYGGI